MSDNTNCWNCNANYYRVITDCPDIITGNITQRLECGVVWNDITLHAIKELINDLESAFFLGAREAQSALIGRWYNE